ncbi:ubiquitin carboxyl-terminal hydrolase 24 [Canna indica]|uniref:Ubiquitin carboxyl-terminal hydrolase 24 n=1 Tax=Canna indica TaxID=4628 RepID=A0AAQ3L0F4_9LILI|nr:ubiquitin carboxyl-terminal hydrolase 24 [Canna indica]
MTRPPVLVFGSFTEDEAKLLQKQSGEDARGPVERAELQFGSLNLQSSDKVSTIQTRETNSSVKLKGVGTSKLVAKGHTGSTESTSKSIPVNIRFQEDGDSRRCSSHTVGVIENGNANSNSVSLEKSEQRIKKSALLASPKVSNGIQESSSQSVYVESVKLVTPTVEILKTVTAGEKEPEYKRLLPRGLINSGNLCFLNATLQGLLSCTPFVQLLQDLRKRNIPKVLTF